MDQLSVELSLRDRLASTSASYRQTLAAAMAPTPPAETVARSASARDDTATDAATGMDVQMFVYTVDSVRILLHSHLDTRVGRSC